MEINSVSDYRALRKQWVKDNHIAAIRDYARETYGGGVFSEHFIERAVERLAPEDRAKVYAEIVSLVKSGMGKFMFRHPKDRINLMLADKFEVVFEPKKNAAGFKIVTIIVPGAERAARVKASH